jgi:formate hydrogenlyase subunit 4
LSFDLGTAWFYVLLLAGAAVFAAVAGMVSSWIDRKVTALVHARRGPPFLQPFYDFFKLMGKENVRPEGAAWTYALMPLVALAAVSVAAAILLGQVLWQNGLLPSRAGGSAHGLVGDIIVVLYLLAVPSLALVLGASASNNPFASVGASREMKLMSYELPMLLAVAAALALAASSERRFAGELSRGALLALPDDSPLRGPAMRMGPELPLRFDGALALRGAGPAPEAELLAARGRARIEELAGSTGRALRLRGLDDLARRAEGDGALLSRRIDGRFLAAGVRRSRIEKWIGLAALAFCVVAVVLCAQAKLGLVPFDCAEAETELAGGVFIEYGGPLLAIWRLSRHMLLFLLPVFVGVVFMGGFRFFVPGGTHWESLGQAGVSLLKYVLILVAFVLVRNTNPRVRIDQAMRFFLGPVTVLAVAALVLALVVYAGRLD